MMAMITLLCDRSFSADLELQVVARHSIVSIGGLR